jgi:hypothetical protein
MSNLQHIHLGPENSPLQQGRTTHGRWRMAYQQAAPKAEDGPPVRATLTVLHDPDRLAFALAEGPAADFLSARLADYLWTRENANGDWPLNLREWLADVGQWTDAPAGLTGFIGGRLERNIAGGRIYLAWLGINGVRLLDRAAGEVTLDTILNPDEGWTPTRGPEPVGMALHAYRGSLFSLERLLIFSNGAEPLRDDLPDLSNPDLQQALADWGAEMTHDLALFDLRLTPVITRPDTVLVNYRWVSPELVTLGWHPSPNVTGYRIEESPTPGFETPTVIAELTDGRQVQYRLSPPASSPRFYRVIPVNQGVPGVPSEPVNPTPMLLAAPILEPILWSSEGGYYLHWTAIPQATSYEVQRSADVDFDPHESEVIYRGEMPEVYLPPDTPPNQYYRVRALNVLYAPNTPSPWSQPLRSPIRLETPTFTRVTQKRIEWTPIAGARQYAVRVTLPDQEDDQGEEILVIDPASAVAGQAATYRVRALRRPNDLRTASEWSDPVTLAPPKPEEGVRRGVAPLMGWMLGLGLMVALLAGMGLGLMGLRAYQEANATATRTPLPQTMVQATSYAATFSAANVTEVARLKTQVETTLDYLRDQTSTAQAWTITPVPTHTFTPTNTPNLTETIEVVFQAGLTATAQEWTPTPSPTDTPEPTETPNLTETIESAFAAGLTATAAGWTATPQPTDPPDLTATFEAAFASGLTATAAGWTETPVPTQTPDFNATALAGLAADLTATAERWTATPRPTNTPRPSATPNGTATAQALILQHLAGCFLIPPPDVPLPVVVIPKDTATVLVEAAPPLAAVKLRLPVANTTTGVDDIWLQVESESDGSMLTGWVRVPPGSVETTLYAGANCPTPE